MDQQQQQQQQQQLAKVERFLKLGYAHGDIVRVLESLHSDAQTNDILEELIKTCHIRGSNKSLPSSPKLVSRGCSPAPAPPRRGPSPGPGPGTLPEREPPTSFRPVVIDGSNVAMSHGDKKVFSCQGIQLAVNWFWDKGLRDITVFIPLWRKEQPRPETPITDQHLLHELENRRILVYTPSRCVNGKRVVCYDDRYIVKLAFDSDGVIVSNDNYRDLQTENPHWKRFIEDRLLMYTFANDKFMPPDDPLGRNGPNIDDFLRKKPKGVDSKPQHCPYGKKCTYGVKCKFFHPERANQSQLSVADELRALRDKAKTFSSLQDTRCYGAPHSPQQEQRQATPPPPAPAPAPAPTLSLDELFLYQRESGGGGGGGGAGWWRGAGLLGCPSAADLDEAFCSLDSGVSRLYVADPGCGADLPLHSRSSGLASYSDCSLDYSGCGGSGGYLQPSAGEHCLHCRCRPAPRRPAAWGSCPPLPPAAHNREQPAHVSDTHYHTQPSKRQNQSQSLPMEPWGAAVAVSAAAAARGSGSPHGERRSGLRSQLSTLFPQSTVEQVLNDYPHVSDLSQLIPLIHSYRSSHMAF